MTSKKEGKTVAEMRAENPNFDRDLERTFHMIDVAEAAAAQLAPGDLIAEHTKLKDWVAAQQKALSDHLKPHVERMSEIENKLLELLNALNAGDSSGKKASLKTDHGTAYLSTIVTPKVTDKEKWLDFCLEDWDQRGAMLQIGNPLKDAVQAYQDEHEGALPPHVETSAFTRVNIRRS